VFNHLAGSLETTLVERNALTQRLIVVQTRSGNIWRANCMTNSAVPCRDRRGRASARSDRARGMSGPRPGMPEHRRTAAHMMDALRGALLRLRPRMSTNSPCREP